MIEGGRALTGLNVILKSFRSYDKLLALGGLTRKFVMIAPEV